MRLVDTKFGEWLRKPGALTFLLILLMSCVVIVVSIMGYKWERQETEEFERRCLAAGGYVMAERCYELGTNLKLDVKK